MRTFVKLLALLLLGMALGACSGTRYSDPSSTRVWGSGRVITEARDVSGFTSLALNGAARLYVERTGHESVSITTDDNVMPILVSQVRGGRLYLELAPGATLVKPTELTVRVTVRELDSLELDGAVVAEVKGLVTDHFQATVSGASLVRLSGKVDQQDVTLSGTGGYDASGMESRRATMRHSGAGAATLRVSEILNADISGLGYIEYIGNPNVTKTISGIGVVRQR